MEETRGALHALSPLSARLPRGLESEPSALIFLANSWASGLSFKRLHARERGLCFRLLAREVSGEGKVLPLYPQPSQLSLTLGKCALSQDVGRNRNGNPELGRLTREKKHVPKHTHGSSRQQERQWPCEPAKR